jgi:3',5'-cyclic AMP phosphodiesterase CpdA
MKKVTMLMMIFIFLIALSGCKAYEIEYTNNLPMTIEMKGEELKILQVTDLHLAYGMDYNDRRTFNLIKDLNEADDYDLIVISGDMAMSPSAPRLFSQLLSFMESLKTPWTFVFGNHETDFHEYSEFLSRIKNTEYLYFKVGPQMVDGGYGNFKINFTKNNTLFYSAYFLDSKAEMEVYTEEEGEYGYLSTAQVEWYRDFVEEDTVDSVVFMHIPLRQFIDSEGYVGIFNEPMVYAQGVDTGFFDAMVEFDRSKGVFVGHDHLNDFYVIQEGIWLVYGRATGYNGYGNLERGGRHIEISSDSIMSTHVVLGSEV